MTTPRRILLGLCCGALAIDINTALLAAADALGLRTAHGGLLRLLQQAATALPERAGGGRWSGILMQATTGSGFQIAFHIGIGLAMAVFYTVAVCRWPPHGLWRNALTYAFVVWLLNSAVVLPAIGEGFAGSHSLTLAGIVGFAVAHTAFFIALALLFDGASRPCEARPGTTGRSTA